MESCDRVKHPPYIRTYTRFQSLLYYPCSRSRVQARKFDGEDRDPGVDINGHAVLFIYGRGWPVTLLTIGPPPPGPGPGQARAPLAWPDLGARAYVHGKNAGFLIK